MATIVDTAAQLWAGSVTARDLVEQALAAVARDQVRTNAFIRVDAEGAREAARRVDEERARGVERGPLHGIPLSLKDLIDVAGQPTTAASRVLAESLAPADATVVTRLREAGAIIIGKTNLHEFALGTTCEDSAYGAVHHPLDGARSAGGSSGGSAAAVACGMGFASIGSDTGGSIRIPAASCGIVGLKPSLGDVPTDGVIPLSTTFDHVGPLTRSVADAAILWAVLAGRDAGDAEQAARPAADGVTRLKLGRVRGAFDRPVAPEVRSAFEQALATLVDAGATVTDVALPSAAGILQAYVNVVLPEGAAWHRRFLDARAADYSPVVRARFESGRLIPAMDYIDALAFCRQLRREVDAALEGVDALVLPTLPITAPLLGSDEITIDPAAADRTPVRSAMLKHTQPFNMTGHPAISLPVPSQGFPVGLQMVGRLDETARLLAMAAACEKIIGYA
jgi:aspartyl-tRNA(Asn)/glutamyl-tRNA(Gln) amidotransferase subunit A